MADENGGAAQPEPPGRAEGSAEAHIDAAAAHLGAAAKQSMADAGLGGEGPSVATAALIGVGIAIIEPELIPGMLIGAGAWAAPKLLPALGNMLRPALKGLVKAGYLAGMTVRAAVAEVNEDLQDMVAEARAEYDAGNQVASGATPAQPGQSPTPAL